jgi:hypothetical protein
MAASKSERNRLTERLVRNDNIFCSMLFDQMNKTLRVVDFRGGNFQIKHDYLEQVLIDERMRKIFTLIERDDMNGWARAGYQREGSIPGYYKRSDAYIMARNYDSNGEHEAPFDAEAAENKKFLNDAKLLGKDISEQRAPSIQVGVVTEEDAMKAIKAEVTRQKQKAKKSKKVKPLGTISDLTSTPPLFPQFSREVEFFYFLIENKRSKQTNVVGAEYQDCFGNTKVQIYFQPESKADQNIARMGLKKSIDHLTEIGAVSLFAVVRADHLITNAIYASLGFRSTGWMNRQLLTKAGPIDTVLWTRKLI